MKKILILVCGVVMVATSCIRSGGSSGNSEATYSGRLTVSDITSGETSYSNDDASVTVQIPNILEPKFDIIFNDVKFDNMMPVKLNIEFEDIPFTTTISEDETTLNYVFCVKDVVPTVGGVPYEKYKVDSIKGSVGRPVTIDFWMSSKEKKVRFSTAKE